MEKLNPFADFGTTVCGPRFIGRDEEIRQLNDRLLSEGGYGSVAVIGLPRVGKTSLLAETIQRAKTKLKEMHVAVVRLELGTYATPDDLFRALVKDLMACIRQEGWSIERVESRGKCVLENSPVSFSDIREVFRSVRQQGIRPLCIFDEFDSTRYLFAAKPECFHWLRELCSNPEFKAAIVLISKRRLQDVARMAGHESNYWSNTLMSLTLRPFSLDETVSFFKRLEGVGVVPDASTQKEVNALCGQHPFLLDVFAYHGFRRVDQALSLDIEWLRSSMCGVVRDYYQQIVTVLRDNSILEKLVQVVYGPQWNVAPDDIEAMVEYGILFIKDAKGLRSFSQGFDDYLRFVEASVDIWPLWRETEKALRSILDELLEKRFGGNWPDELKKSRPKLCQLVNGCLELMSKEQARFGACAASSLLAYTYPMDLFQIMAADWASLGEPILGTDKQAWSIKFGLLAKVRTPLAHNRSEAVQEGERLQAEGICRELLGRITSRQL